MKLWIIFIFLGLAIGLIGLIFFLHPIGQDPAKPGSGTVPTFAYWMMGIGIVLVLIGVGLLFL